MGLILILHCFLKICNFTYINAKIVNQDQQFILL